jgi:hypothetical protein
MVLVMQEHGIIIVELYPWWMMCLADVDIIILVLVNFNCK